jgi:hypothetical protein
MTVHWQSARLHDEQAVARYAATLLNGRTAPEALADLAERINAHPDADGYCGNGCNEVGWRLPYPCPTRLFYEAVRDCLSSDDPPAPTTSVRPPPTFTGTPTSPA